MSPDRRKHRGPHPSDRDLFDEKWIPELRLAVSELSWLLSRGYSARSALKLVGDRHSLRERQRIAVSRSAVSSPSLTSRSKRRISIAKVDGRRVAVDGFNVIVSAEAAVAGGAILHCSDSAFRDLASVHGSYRRVDETANALQIVGNALQEMRPEHITWLLDRPVSNSGRLAAMIESEAQRLRVKWTVELVNDPDAVLVATDDVAATSDSAVLDRCGPWISLTRHIVETYIPDAWVVDVRAAPAVAN